MQLIACGVWGKLRNLREDLKLLTRADVNPGYWITFVNQVWQPAVSRLLSRV